MSSDFTLHAPIDAPALAHARSCRCALHGRRLFTGAVLAAAALPGVQPIYAAAQKPPQKFGPPPKDSSSGTG